MSKYFQLVDDVSPKAGVRTVVSRSLPKRELNLPKRWFLDRITSDGKRVEPWMLEECGEVGYKTLDVRIQYEGEPLDITLIARGVPVVAERVFQILAEISPGSFQCIPASIESHTEKYYVINTLKKIKCVDETRSYFDKWTKESTRPDLAGEYKTFYELRIDARAAGKADLFRLDGWLNAVIISERLKDALEAAGTSGVTFKDVT